MNDELIEKIRKLPNELVDTIKEYVPKTQFIFTNRENYKLYHYLIPIKACNFYTYVKDVVKRDNDYVLNVIIRENYYNWQQLGCINYKNMQFTNYLYFLINYCIENGSENCLKIINIFLKEHGLGKNLHKKNVSRYINGRTQYK